MRIALLVQKEGCPRCQGRLDRADYPRKPRFGMVVLFKDGPLRRIGLCCSREGCRRRVTPPSLVFLGRRVYMFIVVLMACLRPAKPEKVQDHSPPLRTVGRWRTWFRDILPRGSFFTEARSRIMPPIEDTKLLPAALVERFQKGRTPNDALLATLRFLAPITTRSLTNGARFVMEPSRHAELGA
jgi:hypothetical protein